jgi:hypothetical protein
MIQKLITLVLLVIPFSGFSRGRESLPSIWIIKDSVSKAIHKDSVKLVFQVTDHYDQLMLNQHPQIIQVKMDGKTEKFTITDKKPTVKLTFLKGTHHFSFFINANFEEIHFNQELIGSHYYEIGLNFQGTTLSNPNVQVEKPVIYLYSETEQAFNLKITTESELQFTYPVYEKEWKGTTSSNGIIQINGSTYPYLFWDAVLPAGNLKLNWNNADQIQGTQTIDYLNKQLDYLGFNSKEKTDFITYWGPRMQKMTFIQVVWLQNENIEPIASLELSPKFTQNRIYIVFKEINEPLEQTLLLKAPTIKPFNRTKNYLVEWGGIEIQSKL